MLFSTFSLSHGAEVRTDHVFNYNNYGADGAMREAMLEVYIATKDKSRGLSCALLTDLRSKPVMLKKLSRDSVRETMRNLTGGRSIRPLVARLENSGELTKDCGNFLLCDPPVNWREEMVINLIIALSELF